MMKIIHVLIVLMSFTVCMANEQIAIDKFREANNMIVYKEYDKAISLFTEAISMRANFKEAYKNRGVCYSIKKDHLQAISDFKKALEIDPNDATLYNYIGFEQAELGKFEEGLNNIKKALEIDPKYVEAYLNKGVILVWMERNEEAVKHFTTVVSLDPQNPKVYYDRGIAYDKLGNKVAACADWETAKNLNFSLANQVLRLHCQ